MGESHSKSIDSASKQDLDNVTVSEKGDVKTSAGELHSSVKSKQQGIDKVRERGAVRDSRKGNDVDGKIQVNQPITGKVTECPLKQRDTGGEEKAHPEHTVTNKDNKIKEDWKEIENGGQIDGPALTKSDQSDETITSKVNKQQKTGSRKWSLRKHNSKHSKTSKSTVKGQSHDVSEEEEKEVSKEQRTSHSLDITLENTQDGKDPERLSSRKSIRKTKSPSIFRKRSKGKKTDNSDEGGEVKVEEQRTPKKAVQVTSEEKKATETKTESSQREPEARSNSTTAEDVRTRSKSLELKDKKLYVYMKEDNKEKNDSRRAASMKNLKTVKDVSYDTKLSNSETTTNMVSSDGNKPRQMGDTNSNQQGAFLGGPQKPPKSHLDDGNSSVASKPVTSTKSSSVSSTSAVHVTQTAGSYTTPNIVVTLAHEADTVRSVEKSQIRQTAVVTITKEIITSTTTPPEPLSVNTYRQADDSNTTTTSCTAVTTSKVQDSSSDWMRTSEKSVGQPERDERDDSTTRTFNVVELRSPTGKEYKLLQITMQNVCQKANQLNKLMTNMQAAQTSLLAYHRLQLMAIGDKEKEIITAAGRISSALRAEIDQKLGHSHRRLNDALAECKLQLATFQHVIDSGNRVLESGSVDDAIQKEEELACHLRALDRNLRALQEETVTENVDSERLIFVPGTTDHLELRAMFGELIPEDESKQVNTDGAVKGHQRSGPARDLLWSDNPWIPYFRRNTNTSPTGNELMNARIKQELCFRDLTRITNMISRQNFTGFVTELFDCGIDNEMKMKKLCDIIVTLASGHFYLAHTLALLCRCVSSLSVPNDSLQESRQAPRSTVLNFLDRFCMRRYQLGSGQFLATGATPAISRCGSFTVMPMDGSRRSSISGYSTLRGNRTLHNVQRVSHDSSTVKSGVLSTGSTLRPPTSSHLAVDVQAAESQDDELLEESRRRYSNLSLLMFVCEMFKLKLSTEIAVHEWLNRLARVDSHEATEAMCFVLFQIGRYLDHRRAHHVIDKLLVQLTYKEALANTPGRLKAMIRDVLDLQDNNWLPPRSLRYWQFLVG